MRDESPTGEARHAQGDAPTLTVETMLAPSAADALCLETGIRWLYGFLAGVCSRHDREDAVIVLEDRLLGRQVFRARRRAFSGGWATRIALQGRSGLYVHPAAPIDPAAERLVLRLASMALELDVMRDLSLHDPLTGLHNRRGFDELLEQAFEQHRRYELPFSLVLLDLDDFKRLNDRIGHAAGDAVLRAVGEEIARALRRGDVAARVGGDEFALILPGSTEVAGPRLLERLRQRLKADVPHGPIAFSAGAAACPADATERADLFALADRRLYVEKRR